MATERVGQENIRQSLPVGGLNQLLNEEFGGNRGDFVDKAQGGNPVIEDVTFLQQRKLRNPAASFFYPERSNDPVY